MKGLTWTELFLIDSKRGQKCGPTSSHLDWAKRELKKTIANNCKVVKSESS